MISRSFEQPDRTASRASDARNRYQIRYTTNQHRPPSLQVNDHGRVSGTHRPHQRIQTCRLTSRDTILGTHRGIDDIACARRRKRGTAASKTTVPLGLRWAIERTNSWLSNYGQLRRNTDRRPRHRLAQLALAIALILTAKLIDWRNRWSPT